MANGIEPIPNGPLTAPQPEPIPNGPLAAPGAEPIPNATGGGLRRFLAATAAASQKYASQYGVAPQELQIAMLTAAGLEGGLGEEANVGDHGKSFGRFQYYTGGGHGSTLLNQGVTLDQLKDDAFQANDWAPVLAQHLAAVKAQGITGSEAIRQAVFSAERPAQMYGDREFNSAFSQAHSMSGSPDLPAGPIGAGPGGAGPAGSPASAVGSQTYTPDPQLENIRNGLKSAAASAMTKYQKSQSQADFLAYQLAQSALINFSNTFPEPGMMDPSKDPAQKAFTNAITLGDYQSRQAANAFARWTELSKQATAAAQGEATTISDAQKQILANNQARQESKTPGLEPMNLKAGYNSPDYATLLDRWRTKMGVTKDAPSTNPADYPAPDVPTYGGTGSTAPVNGAATTTGSGNESVDALAKPGAGLSGFRDKSGFTTSPGQKLIVGDGGSDQGGPWTNGEQYPFQNMVEASGEDYPFQNYWKDLSSGDPSTIAETVVPAGGINVPIAKKAGKTVGGWIKDLGAGVMGFANGTPSAPGGTSLVGEKGLEHGILPDGTVWPLGQHGPQVVDLPPGTAVIPHDVPPDEAYAYAQVKQAMQKPGPDDSPGAQLAAQHQRATDPNLEQNVIQALMKAVAASDAQQAPQVPAPYGGAKDYWPHLRPVQQTLAMHQQQLAGVK